MATKTEQPVIEQPTKFKISVPPKPNFNKDTGKFDPPTVYNTPAWVKYHEKVRILDGEGETEDIQTALELVDMGAVVTPDPRPFWQEQYAAELKAEIETNPMRAWELTKYVNETNAWRKERGLKPLSVESPNVGRPMSALVMGMQQG